MAWGRRTWLSLPVMTVGRAAVRFMKLAVIWSLVRDAEAKPLLAIAFMMMISVASVVILIHGDRVQG